MNDVPYLNPQDEILELPLSVTWPSKLNELNVAVDAPVTTDGSTPWVLSKSKAVIAYKPTLFSAYPLK